MASLLEEIATNTENTANNISTFWNAFLNQYLQFSATAPHFPATPNLNTDVFNTMQETIDEQSLSAAADTKNIINSVLTGTMNLDNYTNASGDFYGIPPTADIDDSPNNASLSIDSLLRPLDLNNERTRF